MGTMGVGYFKEGDGADSEMLQQGVRHVGGQEARLVFSGVSGGEGRQRRECGRPVPRDVVRQ